MAPSASAVNPPVAAPDRLLPQNNLSDLTDAEAARTALELGELATMNVEDLPDGISLSDANPVAAGAVTPGTSPLAARGDHRHPTDTTRAPLASPVLTGTPEAPTAGVTVNNTQLATTAFVRGYLASSQEFMILPTSNFWALTASGATGSLNPFGVRISCTSAPSTLDYFCTTANAPADRGSDNERFNFSKRKALAFKLNLIFAHADGTFRLTMGKVSGDHNGALTRKGFGILIQNTSLKVIGHNGTTETVGSVSHALTTGQAVAVYIVSDGAGNVSLYVNGTLVETIAGGPTGNSSVPAGIMYECDNNASMNGTSCAIGPVKIELGA